MYYESTMEDLLVENTQLVLRATRLRNIEQEKK